VHGDLRVDNVLVTNDGVAQLNDFGLSHMLDVEGFRTPIIRNIRFTAPELMPIGMQTSDASPNFPTDIFSLAMLLLQLFHGPGGDVQSGLPYNHIPLRSGTEYDFKLLRRIHDPYANVTDPCSISIRHSCVSAGKGTHLLDQISHTS